mmetsp:Transcript_21383/g.43256  ORF Transcript_21383/g.43256 Transcript_21383/m.43256 type:complete len:483 (-) Transcript_21383:250-1698(-)
MLRVLVLLASAHWCLVTSLRLVGYPPVPRTRRHGELLLVSDAGTAEASSVPVPELSAATVVDAPGMRLPATSVLMLIAGLQSSCFGVIGTALTPALRTAGLAPADVAILLGRLGSAAALCEVLLSGSFGALADAIGRKPILLAAPAITVLARASVVLCPTTPMLLGARLVTTLVVPVYWLAYQAAIADCYGRNTTQLAVIGSRVQAAMGFGYALSSLAGGPLAARDLRLAYSASCLLGCCVLACITFGMVETLPATRRQPFKWRQSSSPLAFTRLFRRGSLSVRLNLVVLLQSLTNGMGDLWQVLARELRGWGAAQCGRYAAVAGIATMLGTLLTGPSIRRLGARGHTVASTSASAASAAVLGHATSNAIAFGGVVPMAFGAGKMQATSARIMNLGEEMNVPMGQLSAERNTLNAIIKVVAPSAYAWLFAFGAAHGTVSLPFYSTSFLLLCSAAVAASIPASQWQSPSPQSQAQQGKHKHKA